MKKMLFVLSGLLLISNAMAEPIYRPYASCISPNNNTNLEIMQNTDAKNVAHPYKISVNRMVRGNKISIDNLNTFKVPVQRKDVLEIFQSFDSKPLYAFELIISTAAPFTGQHRAIFADVLGRSVVYCSYHITFGN